MRLVAPIFLAFALLSVFARGNEAIPAWVDQKYLARHAEMMHKVRTLIIPKVDWSNLPLRAAIEDIAYKCQLADPTHQGIHFVIDHRITPMTAARVTYQGENIPLLEILKEMGDFSVTDEDVYLFDAGEGMVIHTFYVPTSFFSTQSGSDAQHQLMAKGVRFPAGETASYNPDTKKLVVRGTRSVEEVDELLNP
jgi:hypothetical protein